MFMKTMKIEKQLLFTDRIKEVVKLELNEALSYRHESEGIRAIGPLFIRGEYQTEENEKQEFQEVLDMDVLAPNHKLSQDKFFLEIKEFTGKPDGDGIKLNIDVMIHGLKEDGQAEVISTKEYEETAAPLIKAMEMHTAPNLDTLSDPKSEEKEEEVQLKEEGTTVSEFEDLFEDSGTTYTSYRMIVAQSNDSYDSIANRYDVSVEDLRATNRNKDVVSKTLLILPFKNA